MTGAAMILMSAAIRIAVVLLSVAAVQGQFYWGQEVIYTSPEICALKRSTVNINCRYYISRSYYARDLRVKFWFVEGRNSEHVDLRRVSEYAGRVQYLETNSDSTLRITDLRESDSAEYKFRFITNPSGFGFEGSPGVFLTVTDVQVQVTTVRVRESHTEAELKCLSRCVPPGPVSYIWFRNGQEVARETTPLHSVRFDPGDDVSCALTGWEDHRSPAVYSPKLPSVSIRPSGEILEGVSVTLTCSSDADPANNYTWYKNNLNPDLQQHIGKELELVFGSIQPSDSGRYYCTAEKDRRKRLEHIAIDVKYSPKPPSVSLSPSGDILEGVSVTLNCSGDANPAANYTWYKENQTLSRGPGGGHRLTSVRPEDRGTYHCRSENQYGHDTKALFIDVQYAPKPPCVSVTPPGDVLEGSSLTLTCSSDANPAANYTWYRENSDLPEASGMSFTITNVTPRHAGNYYCEARNRRGRHSATWYLRVSSGTTVIIMNIIRLILLVLMLIHLLLLHLWIRKKTLSSSTELNEPVEIIELDSPLVYENISDLKRTEVPKEQEELE